MPHAVSSVPVAHVPAVVSQQPLHPGGHIALGGPEFAVEPLLEAVLSEAAPSAEPLELGGPPPSPKSNPVPAPLPPHA